MSVKIAAAMNAARAGRIINDSEEPFRDAVAAFREQAFQKAVDLLASEQSAEAFSPSASRRPGGDSVEEQGTADGHARDGQRRG